MKKKSYRYSLMFLLFLLFSSCRYQWAEPTKNVYHIISQWQRRVDELRGYCSPWWRILFVSVYVMQNTCPVVGMLLSKMCTLMVISIQKYFEHKSFNFSEHLVSLLSIYQVRKSSKIWKLRGASIGICILKLDRC